MAIYQSDLAYFITLPLVFSELLAAAVSCHQLSARLSRLRICDRGQASAITPHTNKHEHTFSFSALACLSGASNNRQAGGAASLATC